METITNKPAPVGYGQLIRENRNFRYLWFGQIVSLLGDWFNLIASAALLATLTKSGFAIGSLFVVRMLAPFLVSPIAGVVADRYNRRQILIMTDLVRAVAVFCFLFVREADDVWLLYTLTAIQLGLSGFFFPARNAILPDIVSPPELGAANALGSATWSIMLAVGAAIGGLISGVWGSDVAFIIDGLTFLLSAVFLLQVKLTVTPTLDAGDKTIGAALQQYFDGVRYLSRQRDILVIAIHKAAVALFMSSAFQVIQVVIAERIFVIGEGGGISLGIMFGVAGIGTGIGPIVARYFTKDRDRPLRQAITLGYILGILGLVATAPLTSFGLVLFGITLRGIGGGIIWVFSTQLLLQRVSHQVRGRVFASEFAFFTLAGAGGAALAGQMLDSPLSIGGAIWLMAGLGLIPTIFWLWWLGGPKPKS